LALLIPHLSSRQLAVGSGLRAERGIALLITPASTA
jgi:hypothetical protein